MGSENPWSASTIAIIHMRQGDSQFLQRPQGTLTHGNHDMAWHDMTHRATQPSSSNGINTCSISLPISIFPSFIPLRPANSTIFFQKPKPKAPKPNSSNPDYRSLKMAVLSTNEAFVDSSKGSGGSNKPPPSKPPSPKPHPGVS